MVVGCAPSPDTDVGVGDGAPSAAGSWDKVLIVGGVMLNRDSSSVNTRENLEGFGVLH